jgi:hypothetical protein
MALRNTKQASVRLYEKYGVKRAPITLEKARSTGKGPPFRRFGVSVYYDDEDLDAWVASLLSKPLRSTSELSSHSA